LFFSKKSRQTVEGLLRDGINNVSLPTASPLKDKGSEGRLELAWVACLQDQQARPENTRSMTENNTSGAIPSKTSSAA
jgi:hypothetical protein